MSEPPVMFMTHDPETKVVTADLPAAVMAGAEVLGVAYNEESNQIEVVVSKVKESVG